MSCVADAERARWRCEYCRTPAAFSTQPFEVDHIIPRKKAGRTALAKTVEALLMNRPELVNLRRLLHLIGEHPPTFD